jgi:hypothetical protein
LKGNIMAPYRPTRRPQNTAGAILDYDDDEAVAESQFRFLQEVWNIKGDIGDTNYFFLAFKDVRTGKWTEHAITDDASFLDIHHLLAKFSRWDFDQYFCPNPFSEPRRKRQYALPTRFGWCDMDASDPDAYDPRPGVVWSTSPRRYQALWAWDEVHKVSDAEQFSKALAYRHGGDKNGWSATKMLRLIGSVNHKPKYDEPFVRTIAYDWAEIASRPLPMKGARGNWPVHLANIDADPGKHSRDAVLMRYWRNLHPKVRTLIRNRKAYEPDRSGCIFHIIAGLHEAGANVDEIAAVLWDNPYFLEKHGRDLNKLNDELSRVIGKIGGAS